MEHYVVTGNDFVSLPKIDERKGSIENFTFLYMGAKGLYQVAGNSRLPFLRPFLTVNGKRIETEKAEHSKICFWIPEFNFRFDGGELHMTVFAPTESRGFMVRLRFRNDSSEAVRLGLGIEGLWASTTREINVSDPVSGEKQLQTGWFDTPVFVLTQGVPVFAFAFLFDKEMAREISSSDEGIFYRFHKEMKLDGRKESVIDCAFGLGCESVAAVTSALDMLRHGFDRLLSETEKFLSARICRTSSKNAKADFMINYNLFFCFYFAAGMTLDTEEFVTVTSRSPRYYVSAAYWDRDGFLWAFPAVLETDALRAKQMLQYAFGRQLKNVGVHSRYIDGTVLEPGFELDELCAPAVALCRYFKKTGDKEFICSENVLSGVRRILSVLDNKKHESAELYETFLYPSDDMIDYPYLTYDNALVAYMVRSLADIYDGILPDSETSALKERSENILAAIAGHCIVKDNGKPVYAWCVDLKGNYKIYDEPPGSLVLLAYLGACNREDAAYKNTVARLYAEEYEYSFAGEKFSETGCAHSPHPWVLSYCNSVLADRERDKTVREMTELCMDNFLACEAVSEATGECATGEAFATCAGLYAYVLIKYYKERN